MKTNIVDENMHLQKLVKSKNYPKIAARILATRSKPVSEIYSPVLQCFFSAKWVYFIALLLSSLPPELLQCLYRCYDFLKSAAPE